MSTYIHSIYDAAANGTGAAFINSRRQHRKGRLFVTWQGQAGVGRVTVTVSGRNNGSSPFMPLATFTETDFTLGRLGGTVCWEDLVLPQEIQAQVEHMTGAEFAKVFAEFS